MKRKYLFTWYENKSAKYRTEPLTRHTEITLSKPTGKVEFDAKMATNIFTKAFGSLKNITIVSIKEFDENGKQIGADITPSENSKIIPTKKSLS